MNINAFRKDAGVEALRYNGRMSQEIRDFFEETKYFWQHFDPPMRKDGTKGRACLNYSMSMDSRDTGFRVTVYPGDVLIKVERGDHLRITHMTEENFLAEFEWFPE